MNYDKQIKEIMMNFDFEKVHKVMEFLNWTWFDKGVPSVEQLRESAKHLLNTVAENDDLVGTRTGGFHVIKNSNKELSLYFNLSWWNAG